TMDNSSSRGSFGKKDILSGRLAKKNAAIAFCARKPLATGIRCTSSGRILCNLCSCDQFLLLCRFSRGHFAGITLSLRPDSVCPDKYFSGEPGSRIFFRRTNSSPRTWPYRPGSGRTFASCKFHPHHLLARARSDYANAWTACSLVVF